MFRKSRLSVQRKNEFRRLRAERASADMAENNLVVRIPLEVWREARVVNLEQLKDKLSGQHVFPPDMYIVCYIYSFYSKIITIK